MDDLVRVAPQVIRRTRLFLQRNEGRNPPKCVHSNDFALSPMKYCEKDQINIKRTMIILTNHINNQKTMTI